MSAPGANSSLLAAFTTLADVDSAARQEAVHTLLQLLRDAQKAFEEQSKKLGTLPALPAARPCCNELTYAIGRLTRGITSNNAAARQGYAVALVEAMQTFPNVRVSEVMDQLKKATQPGSNASKAEQRDALLGKVFGAIALIRSGRLVDTTSEGTGQGSNTPGSKGAAGNAALSYVVSELITAGSRKDWISASASEGLSTLLALLPWCSWQAVSAPLDDLFPAAGSAKDWSALQLHAALAVEAAWLRWGPSTGGATLPSYVHKLRVALASLTALAARRAAGEEGQEEEGGSAAGAAEGIPLGVAVQSSAKALPSLHGLWGLLLRRYTVVLGEHFFGEEAEGQKGEGTKAAMDEDEQGEKGQKRGDVHTAYRSLHSSAAECVGELTAMWKVLVEGCLLRSGPEKKGLALALLESVIRRTGLSPTAQSHAGVLLDAWLGPVAVRVLQQHATHKKDPLNKQCHATLKALVAVAEGKPSVASAALVALASRGHPAFDRITHTSTLSTLLTQLDGVTLLAHVRALVARFVSPSVLSSASAATNAAPGSASKQQTVVGAVATKESSKKKKGAGKKGSKQEEEEEDSEEGVDISDAALVKAFGSGEADSHDEEDEENGDGGKGSGAPALSPLDQERVQCVDVLLSAIKQPALAILRDNGTAAALFSLLSFHVSASVTLSTAASATGSGASGKATAVAGEAASLAALAAAPAVVELKPHLVRLADGGGSTHAAVSLLVATPPLSPACRAALQAKLAPALREVSMASAAVQPQQAAAGEAEEASKGDRLLKSSQALLSCCLAVNAGMASGQALGTLCTQGGQGAPHYKAQAHLALPQEEEEEDSDEEEEEDDEDDEEEEEGPILKPTEVCARALSAAHALHAIAHAVPSTLLRAAWVSTTSTEDAGKKAKAMRRVEALRAVSSYGSLLALLPVVISVGAGQGGGAAGAQASAGGAEDGVAEGSVSASKLAEALNDLLIASRSVLSSSVRVLEKAVGSAGSGSVADQPVSAGKGGSHAKRGGANTPAANGGESAKAFSQAVSRLATATAEAVLAVGADEDEEGDEGEEGALSGPDKDAAVFFDALLSILAEPSATLREAVKLAARACAGVGAVSHADVLGSVLGVLAHGVGGQPQAVQAGAGGGDKDDSEGEEDGDGHAHGKAGGHDSDDESITLDAGSGDNPLAMLVGSGSGKAGRAAADTRGAGGKRRRQEESEDSDEEEEEFSDEEEEEEEEEDEAAIRAGMETHDRMLEGILRMTRAKTNAARDQARRDTHFRFRAYDLLEAAVTRLADGKPGAGSSEGSEGSGGGGCAPPVLCLLLSGLLEVVRRLSARTKAKKAAGNESAAQDAQKLVDKVCSLLSRACKARVPVLLAQDTTTTTAGGVQEQAQLYTAAGVHVQWALHTLATALESARAAPTPSALEASGSVASLCLRLLRDPGQVVATSLSPSAAVGAVPQPHASVLEPVVSFYASCLHSLLTERHPRITAAFLRHSLSSYPTLAVRLLPALAGVLSTRPCPIPRAFRVAEAVQLGAALARVAQAPWAAALPCAPAAAAGGVGGDRAKGSKGAPVPATVGGALPAAVSDMCSAIASTLRDFASPSAGPSTGLMLPAKILRDLLEPLRTAQKQGVMALAEGPGAGGKGLEQLCAALSTVAALTPNEHVRRQSVALLTHAGQPIPEHTPAAPSAGQAEEEGMDEDEQEAEGQAASKRDVKAKKQDKQLGHPSGGQKEKGGVKAGGTAGPRQGLGVPAAHGRGAKQANKGQSGQASKKHKLEAGPDARVDLGLGLPQRKPPLDFANYSSYAIQLLASIPIPMHSDDDSPFDQHDLVH